MSDCYDAVVLVVGAGPTGLAVANALGRSGVSTILIERDQRLNAMPRAVSIDDESMRLLQSLGLEEAARSVARPGTGTHFYGRHGRALGRMPDTPGQPLGHPLKNPIDHGAFLTLLLEALAELETVRTWFGMSLTAIAQDDEGVTATLACEDGTTSQVRSRFVLGCDGGRSTTRRLVGIEMEGSSARDPWFVIDVSGDPHDQRYAMHHGDPDRPHVIVPGGNGRCRYEFLLRSGEDQTVAATSIEFARRLLRPYRPDLTAADVVRQQVYVFHAVIARRWRAGRVFLLGDAAHMMPPFAGQGLNSGLRDAGNLGWKIAAVDRGELRATALESYELERRPNAEAMIRLSVRRGRTMMTTSRHRAAARDVLAGAARLIPPLRRRLDHMPAKPYPRYGAGLMVPTSSGHALTGALVPQPRMLLSDGRLEPLDDLLGPGFALIGVELDGEELIRLEAPVWNRIGACRLELILGERFPAERPGHAIASDADGTLSSALLPIRGQVVVVRPDRFILGTFEPGREREFVQRWESDAALTTELAEPLDPTLRPAGAGLR